MCPLPFFSSRQRSDSAPLPPGLGLHEREIVLANFLEPLIWGEIAAARYAIAVFFALPLLSSLLGVVLGFASLSFLLQVALGFPFLFSFLQYQTG